MSGYSELEQIQRDAVDDHIFCRIEALSLWTIGKSMFQMREALAPSAPELTKKFKSFGPQSVAFRYTPWGQRYRHNRLDH